MLRWPKLEPAAAREAAPLPKGGWHRPFRFHALEVVTATRAEAEAYEQAWRVKASREGWRIYAKPPGIVVNPTVGPRPTCAGWPTNGGGNWEHR